MVKETWFQMRMYFSPYYYPINPYKFGILGRERIKFFRKRNLKRAFAKENSAQTSTILLFITLSALSRNGRLTLMARVS